MTEHNHPKVVFTVTNDLSFDRRMQRICSTLQDAGIEVLLVGRLRKNSTELTPQPYAQHRIPCIFDSGKLFYIEYNLRLFIYLFSLKNILIGAAIDLDTIWPIVRVAKLKNWKIVYDAHELFHEVPEVVDRPLVKKIWQWIGNRFIPKVDLAYTVGDQLGQYFTESYGIPFKVIRNVPKSITAPKNYNTSDQIILYQGMVNRGRGVREMIEALADFPKFKFWIVGNGDEYEEIKNWVKGLDYSKQVQFFGFVKPKDLAAITEKATIGINLLENKGLSYYYSLANKTFDYTQAGIPSIQMDFPEYAALQKTYNCFYLLKELEVGQIKSILSEIEINPQNLRSKHEHAIEAAKVLNWENESQKLISLYKGLLNH